jgi:alpha-maltose-1-phosphate synthase
MKKVKVLLAHPGTQHAKYLAVQLYKRNLLFKFCSGIMIPRNNLVVKLLLSLLPGRIRKKVNYRFIDTIPFKYLKMFPWEEYQTVKKVKNTSTYKEEVFFKRNRNFQNKIGDKYLKECDVIIGFDTSSWILAEKAKRFNKKIIIDHTTAEPTGKAEIIKAVADAYPEWKFDLQPRFDSYLETDIKEHNLADRIVVASTYSKETLVRKNISPEKILINPYGVNTDIFSPAQKLPSFNKVKFLFVGSVTALKGIPLLLKAWEGVNADKAELLIAGPVSEEVRAIIGNRKGIQLLGSFSKEELPAVYRKGHVFIFPSFTEGFGQVILEALACGLPVITTANTAGKDLVENGIEGVVIPAGDDYALLNSINYFMKNQIDIKNMSLAARAKATKYTWSSYGDRWEKIINDLIV